MIGIDADKKPSYNVNSKIVLRCACCNAPFGCLVLTLDGRYALLIESRHHGEMHENLFPLPNALKSERNAPE